MKSHRFTSSWIHHMAVPIQGGNPETIHFRLRCSMKTSQLLGIPHFRKPPYPHFLGLFKVMFYFPNRKSTMTGESIVNFCFIFWAPLKQIQDFSSPVFDRQASEDLLSLDDTRRRASRRFGPRFGPSTGQGVDLATRKINGGMVRYHGNIWCIYTYIYIYMGKL